MSANNIHIYPDSNRVEQMSESEYRAGLDLALKQVEEWKSMNRHHVPVYNTSATSDIDAKKPHIEFENDILEERYSTYGDPVVMHERIAKIWSGILNHPIEANEVALCMMGMKLARSQNDPTHEDSLVDVAGYNEIAQLIQSRKDDHA